MTLVFHRLTVWHNWWEFSRVLISFLSGCFYPFSIVSALQENTWYLKIIHILAFLPGGCINYADSLRLDFSLSHFRSLLEVLLVIFINLSSFHQFQHEILIKTPLVGLFVNLLVVSRWRRLLTPDLFFRSIPAGMVLNYLVFIFRFCTVYKRTVLTTLVVLRHDLVFWLSW